MREKSESKRTGAQALSETNAYRLMLWVRDNPAEGLSPAESQIALLALLWGCHVPHNLMQFLSLTDKFPAILEAFQALITPTQLIRLERNGIYLGAMYRLAVHLQECEQELAEIFGQDIRSVGRKNRHPMSRHLGIYYVYSALMTEVESESDDVDDLLTQIKAIVLYSHMVLIVNEFPPQQYLLTASGGKYQTEKAGRYQTIMACRFIRQASHDAEGDMLDHVEGFSEIYDLYQHLESQKEASTEAFTKLYPLLRLHYRSIGEAHHSKWGGKGRGRWIFKGWRDGYVAGRDGVYAESMLSEGHDLSVIGISDTNEEEVNAGLDPDENAAEDELILVGDDSPSAGRLLSKAQVNHIEMANQNLRFDWSRNTNAEIAEFLRLCGKIIRSQFDNSLIKQTVAIAMIMLVTGEDIDRVVTRFRYIKKGKALSNKNINFIHDESTGNGFWRIHPALPKQQSSLGRNERSFCERRRNYMDLPDIFNVSGYVRRAFSEKELNSDGKLFRSKVKTYRTALNSIIAQLPSGNRVNEHRIRSHLFNLIVSESSGDTAEATLISGRYHPLAKTRLHYTALPVDYLQRLYTDALTRMISDVYAEGFPGEEANSKNFVEKTDFVIGSDYCPTVQAVQNAVGIMLDRIRRRSTGSSLREIADYHNAYTLYTVMLLGYATGYRAVVDPFPQNPDIDRSTGMCVISDKDGPDFYNARIVWLPDICIRQLDHYDYHRQAILSYLPLNLNNISVMSDLPELFLLDESFEVVNVRPRTLEPLLREILPLPVNSNRRFLRTHLRLSGCPTEVVDAFMGHWSRGEEPWGRYSTLTYSQVIDTLKIYLEPILSTMGFGEIRSRFNG